MINIDLQSRQPIYEQLKDKITKLTALGLLEENTKLPSVRSLARDVGVNPNTVQKAYQQLERDDIIYSISGKGSFVASKEASNKKIKNEAIVDIKTAIIKGKDNFLTEMEIVNLTHEIFIKESEKND